MDDFVKSRRPESCKDHLVRVRPDGFRFPTGWFIDDSTIITERCDYCAWFAWRTR